MNATLIAEVAARVANVAEIIDGSTEAITRVEITEMADGSRRHCALVYTYDDVNELEQVWRVSSPVPWNSPAWAAHYTDWTLEIRGAVENGTWHTIAQVDA